MDPCKPNPADLEKCAAPISVSRGNSIAGRFLAHISRETSSGRFIPEMDGLRFAAIGMVILFHLNACLTAKSRSIVLLPPIRTGLSRRLW
jgi:hypothetical protein